MSSSRMRGALAGFLATFVSRHSDHDGYWIFGFLALRSEPLVVDLLARADEPEAATGTAVRLARMRFADQVAKARVDPSALRSAVLEIAPRTSTARVRVGLCDIVDARAIGVRVTAQLASGATLAREVTVHAAPHDPGRELRSRRRA